MTTNDQDTGARGDQTAAAATTRKLHIFRAGAQLFAVPAEEVEATARSLTPTPLPFAPRAVLGVVSLRGRIRTVIDPLRLDEDARGRDASPINSSHDNTPRLFVALAGDEQLALACDAAEGEFEIAPTHIVPSHDPRSHLRGTFERAGSRVALLDPSSLFDAATRGTERRRRRS
jgi:chemotaxis signal transduction protein